MNKKHFLNYILSIILILSFPQISWGKSSFGVSITGTPSNKSHFIIQIGIKLGVGASPYGSIFTGLRLNLIEDVPQKNLFFQEIYDVDIPPWPPLWFDGKILAGIWQKEWYETRNEYVEIIYKLHPKMVTEVTLPYKVRFRKGFFASIGTMMVPSEMPSPHLSSAPIEVANNNFKPEVIPQLEMGLRIEQDWHYKLIINNRKIKISSDLIPKGFIYIDGGLLFFPPLNGGGIFARLRYGSGLSGISVALRLYYLRHSYKYISDLTSQDVQGQMFGAEIISDWDGEHILTLLGLIYSINN